MSMRDKALEYLKDNPPAVAPTPERLDFIREFYGIIPATEMAKITGMSIESVQSRAKRLGVRAADNRARYEEELKCQQTS